MKARLIFLPIIILFTANINSMQLLLEQIDGVVNTFEDEFKSSFQDQSDDMGQEVQYEILEKVDTAIDLKNTNPHGIIILIKELIEKRNYYDNCEIKEYKIMKQWISYQIQRLQIVVPTLILAGNEEIAASLNEIYAQLSPIQTNCLKLRALSQEEKQAVRDYLKPFADGAEIKPTEIAIKISQLKLQTAVDNLEWNSKEWLLKKINQLKELLQENTALYLSEKDKSDIRSEIAKLRDKQDLTSRDVEDYTLTLSARKNSLRKDDQFWINEKIKQLIDLIKFLNNPTANE